MTLNITTIMRIKNIFMATLLGVMLHSCEFLDVVPDDTSTLDDAFKTETNAGNFIYVQSPNQKIPDRKTKCVIKTHINIKQNVIFGAKLKPV